MQFRPELFVTKRHYEKWEKADMIPHYVYRIAEIGERSYHITEAVGSGRWFPTEHTWDFFVYDSLLVKVPCP